MNARTKKRNALGRRSRRGTAVTELAICMPAIFVLVFASVECSTMIFLKQSMTLCAYEGARLAAHPSGKSADANTRIDQIAAGRDLDGVTVNFSVNPDALDRGEEFTCTVTAPSESNTFLPTWFFGGKTMSGAVTMLKE